MTPVQYLQRNGGKTAGEIIHLEIGWFGFQDTCHKLQVREYDDLLRHRANTGTWGTAEQLERPPFESLGGI